MRAHVLIAALACLAMPAAAADWTLEPDASALGFVTIKNGDTAESHSFSGLSGTVAEDGAASVTVPLVSVETFIDIRNERMRDILFAASPQAEITAQIDLDMLADLAPGTRRMQELEVTLAANGQEVDYLTEVAVTRIADSAVSVSTVRPLIADARDLAYDGGVEQLREIAGLDAISPAVPVSFDLMFTK
ncbi:MAG: YceI family protein [Pseudomonadota bacterium]